VLEARSPTAKTRIAGPFRSQTNLRGGGGRDTTYLTREDLSLIHAEAVLLAHPAVRSTPLASKQEHELSDQACQPLVREAVDDLVPADGSRDLILAATPATSPS